MGTHDPYEALRQRDYRCLLSGNVLSSIGAQIQTTVVEWEIYQRTGSKMALGLTGLVLFLPVLLLALPAGHTVDRFNRKYVYLSAQFLLLTASLGLASRSYFEAPIELVFLCLVLAGVGRAFSGPARSSLLPQVVPASALANAVTWNSSGWQIANVVGPALGGLLLALGSDVSRSQAALAYAASFGCFLACILVLTFMRPRTTVRAPRDRSLASLLAGVRFVWRTDLLLAAITLDLFAVLLGGATVLLPVFAKDILHVGEIDYGWLRSAPALGALVMAVFMAFRRPLRRAGSSLLLAVAGYGLATVVFGLSRDFYLSFAMLALTGALDNISVVIRGTLMQTLTPDDMRGRVGAVNSVFITSSNELGAFESGVTAAWFGTVWSVVMGGVGTIVVVGLVMLRWPSLTRLGSLTGQPAPELAVEETSKELV